MGVDVLAELIADLPDGTVVTDPAITEGYRQDRAFHPSAGKPMAVVRPQSTEQVQTVLRWASANRVPVVPRGAGSGLSGGATALDGGIVLSTEKMRDISVDPVTRTAVCQPGLFNAEVKKAVAEYGLWYPPDPSSYEICSIGGNIATNAGGLCCVKYGVTTDYVLGMQVVLADGTAVRLGGPRLKDVAGLSLTKLFVGSEGTLGVVTEVTLRLLPAQNVSSVVVASFASVDAAVDAVLGVAARLRPSMLEFMDSVAINAVEDTLRMDLDRGAAAMLVAGSDERGRASGEDAEVIAAVFAENGATEVFSTDDPDEGEAFVAARRFCIPAVEAKGSLLLEDVGVPLPALGKLVTGISRIASERDLMISVIAHAGDGNTHPLIVYDPADPA
ncbi:MAG TPA: FAD-binding protein, partial [Mycobacterium sp.]